jgi:hypothetical protein
LGEELPLSPVLLKALRDEKQLKPILEEGKYLVRVTTTQAQIVQPVANFVLKTEFLLECERPERVCYPSKDACEPSATIAWSPKSCRDTSISISVSCDRRCVERATLFGIVVTDDSLLRLTKRYPGQSGFLGFMKDFSTGGSREFGSSDFASSAGPAERPQVEKALRDYHIDRIKIVYNVQVLSSGLDKLLSLPSPIVPLTIAR